MGDQSARRVAPLIFDSSASPLQPPADPTQALADRAQAPADQAQALALAREFQALGTQAQALTTQAQVLVAPQNDVDAEEKKVFAYKEIANLHEINLGYPIHKLALEEWQRRVEHLSTTVSRREVRYAELTNQIYNIFGWFAVFQGVVLTAVSQLTQTAQGEPLCGKIWVPIVLTGFATVATIAGIVQKFSSLIFLRRTIDTDTQAKSEFAKRVLRLCREGPQKFKFHLDTDNCSRAKVEKPFWKDQLRVIVLLVILTFIFILSYFVILCDTWVVRNWDGGLHR